jgi:hypothetical protein
MSLLQGAAHSERILSSRLQGGELRLPARTENLMTKFFVFYTLSCLEKMRTVFADTEEAARWQVSHEVEDVFGKDVARRANFYVRKSGSVPELQMVRHKRRA